MSLSTMTLLSDLSYLNDLINSNAAYIRENKSAGFHLI